MSHGLAAYTVELTALRAAAHAPLAGPDALHALCAAVGQRLPDEAMNPCHSSQMRELKQAITALGGDPRLVFDNLIIGSPPVPMADGDFVSTIQAPRIARMAAAMAALDPSGQPRSIRRALQQIQHWYTTAVAQKRSLVIIDS